MLLFIIYCKCNDTLPDLATHIIKYTDSIIFNIATYCSSKDLSQTCDNVFGNEPQHHMTLALTALTIAGQKDSQAAAH